MSTEELLFLKELNQRLEKIMDAFYQEDPQDLKMAIALELGMITGMVSGRLKRLDPEYIPNTVDIVNPKGEASETN
jgi:hypothetical protein